MSQARSTRIVHALLVASLFVLLVSAAIGRSGTGAGADLDAQRLAAVIWPPSTGLLVSEVVTGGTSASDEFIEIYNASANTLDLSGLELVYATATGTTVTRKQSWLSVPVPSHHHVLLANSSGRWATGADGVYSGGLASTGGSLVLRVVGGEVVDALSWGDASSAFVEGSAATAPPASSSLERKPGGSNGNATDTNNNAADAIVNGSPVAESLSTDVQPSATPNGTPRASAAPTPTPTPVPTGTELPTSEPTSTPQPTPPCSPDGMEPTAEPTQETSVEPTQEPTVEATSTSVSSGSPESTAQATFAATPGADLTPEPTAIPATTAPVPTQPVVSIASAREGSLGTMVAVRAVLTTPFGLLDSGRTAYADDGSGALSIVTAFDPPALPVGTDLSVVGQLGRSRR